MNSSLSYQLKITLRADATFGRGDGVAGLVDVEVAHDARTGLPFLHGRTLKGLLVEECANILYALQCQKAADYVQSSRLDSLERAANALFGSPGSRHENQGLLRVGAGELPAELRRAVRAELKKTEDDKNSNGLTPQMALDSLTSIRRQTAVDEATGAPEVNSLRAIRVVLRETVFLAPVWLRRPLDSGHPQDVVMLSLLTACARAAHRGGLGRNRGRGRLDMRLLDANGAEVPLVLEALCGEQPNPAGKDAK